MLEMVLFYDNWMSESTVSTMLEYGPAFVARLGSELVGYALTNYHQGVLDLVRLGVVPARHGCGIGRLLLEEVVEVEHHLLTLTVKKDNTQALKLYKRFGFKLHGELESAWVLLRTSSSPTPCRSGRTCRSSSHQAD